VVYVIDATKISIMSSKLEEKLAAIRKKVNSLGKVTIFMPIMWLIQIRLYIELTEMSHTSLFSGIAQIVLLTKVDEACPLVEEDLQSLYVSSYIKTKVRHGHMIT